MPISLYDATIPTQIQMLNAAQGWMEKAKASAIADEEIARACLTQSMAPLAKQVHWMLAHSVGAIEALRKGEMNPQLDEPTTDLEKMRLNLGAAENQLRALSVGELESFAGQEVRFVFRPHEVDVPFTAENFLLSFAQPNFFFHCTTAYAILRHIGLDLGKRDYLGQMRSAQ